jgi:hypothetical protein
MNLNLLHTNDLGFKMWMIGDPKKLVVLGSDSVSISPSGPLLTWQKSTDEFGIRKVTLPFLSICPSLSIQ